MSAREARNIVQMGLNDLEEYSLLHLMRNCEVTLLGQFLKICSALRVPQLENTVIKEKQNSRPTTRKPHDTVMKCVTDSRTHVDDSQREKESSIIIVQGLAFISATILCAVWSLMLKQN